MKLLALMLCIAAMLGCQSHPFTVSNTLRFAYPSMVFDGAYAAHLTVADVRQIVAIGKGRPDILKPIHKIITEQPDDARVEGGDPQQSRDPITIFKVHREHGHWRLIEKSLYTTRETLITS